MAMAIEWGKFRGIEPRHLPLLSLPPLSRSTDSSGGISEERR